MTDILDLIDEVTAPICGWCQLALSADGPSEHFCDDVCQFEWQQLRGVALVGYREPTDLAVHVENLEELASPETTPARPYYGGAQVPDDFMRMLFQRIQAHRQFLVDRLLGGTPFTFEWVDAPLFPPAAMQWIPPAFEGVVDYVRPTPGPTVEIFPWRVIPLPDVAALPEPMPPLPEVAHTTSFFYSQHGDPVTAPVTGPVVRVESLGSAGIPTQYTDLSAGLPRRQRAPRMIRPRGCS